MGEVLSSSNEELRGFRLQPYREMALILHAWHDELLVGMAFFNAIIKYVRRIGTRALFCRNLQFCMFFRPDPRVIRPDPRVGRPDRLVRPAGRRHYKGPPAGRCECETGKSAGSTSTRGSRWRDQRMTSNSRHMTPHNQRDFQTSFADATPPARLQNVLTRPDLGRESFKPLESTRTDPRYL